MEKNWERTLPLIHIDINTVKRLFNGIVNEKDVSSATLIEEGCRTTNYIVETINNKKKYILKIFYNKDFNYKKEIKIFNMIKNNVPVQKIYKIDQDPIINNREYVIYEYIEGKAIGTHLKYGECITEDLVKCVARTLGKIHSYKFDKIGFFDENLNIEGLPPVNTWYKRFLTENSKLRLGENVVNKINYIVKYNEKKILELDKDPRLVHGDFQGTNILINNNTLSGVIDWEFAMSGHPLADIGQFFRYEEYFNEELIRAFEEEYKKTSTYKLIDEWYKISKLRDLISLIQLIDQKKEMPNKYKEIKHIVDNILEKF